MNCDSFNQRNNWNKNIDQFIWSEYCRLLRHSQEDQYTFHSACRIHFKIIENPFSWWTTTINKQAHVCLSSSILLVFHACTHAQLIGPTHRLSINIRLFSLARARANAMRFALHHRPSLRLTQSNKIFVKNCFSTLLSIVLFDALEWTMRLNLR